MKGQSVIHNQPKGINMKAEMESSEAVEFVPEDEIIDPIEVILKGECPSVSGRSVLDFEVGRSSADGTLHLRISDNSGKGMWSKEWCGASDIQDIVLGEGGLTAKSFHPIHAGRSINTGGFILAALKELGLIRANEENTRLHEHVPGTTFEKVVSAHMAATKAVKPETGGRKTLRLKAN
jgi:hypothetical protein